MDIDSAAQYGDSNDGFNMSTLVSKLWQTWRILAVTLVVFLLIGCGALVLIPPKYEAQVVISPKDDSTSLMSLMLPSLFSSLGGGGLLSNLFGGKGGPIFDNYMNILQSNILAHRIATQRPDVMHQIFWKQWDWEKREWKQRTTLGAVAASFKSALGLPIKNHPDQDDLVDFLNQKLTINKSFDTSLVTISLDMQTPEAAEQVLRAILVESDSIIRSQRLTDEKARVAYIQKILPTITNADQRGALISLLSLEQQTLEVLSADKFYAAAVIDPSRASRTPSSPKPAVLLGMALVLAVFTWGGAAMLLPANHPLRGSFGSIWWALKHYWSNIFQIGSSNGSIRETKLT